MTRLRGKPLSQNASPSAGQTLPAGATKEHTLVAQTLLVISGPMFPDKVQFIQQIKLHVGTLRILISLFLTRTHPCINPDTGAPSIHSNGEGCVCCRSRHPQRPAQATES